MQFSLQPLYRFNSNFTQTYLGVRQSAERETTSNDLDPGKRRPFFIWKITFLYFSPRLLRLFQPNLAETLLQVRGTISLNMTSNDLDLVKWRPFKGEKLTFLHFFLSQCQAIIHITTKLGRNIARGNKGAPCPGYDLKRP